MIQTLEWTPRGVVFIDQTKLPTEEVYVTCTTHQQVADAIRNMVVRGAPAIGVAAAFGMVLAARAIPCSTQSAVLIDLLTDRGAYLKSSRPTAVNLFWAVKRMRGVFEKSLSCQARHQISGLIAK